MAWFFLGFLVYFLVLLSERILVGVTAHDIEQLRTTQTWQAQQAYRLARQVRPAFAALLLARVLLKIMLSVFVADTLMRYEPVRTGLYQLSTSSGLPGTVIWTLGAGVLVVVLATLLWVLKKIQWPTLNGNLARTGLQYLVPFFLFWKILFWPFLPAIAKADKNEDVSLAIGETAPLISVSPTLDDRPHDIELLKSIVKFSDVTIKQVMQPRSKVVAVDFRTGFGDLLRTVREAGFSRIPVFDEDLDNATGILYVKDLVPHLDKPDDFEWQTLIRDNPHFVPEAKAASEMLRDFKRNRQHIALVVDEYGGCSGIVTLEDILEEITGEIRDEFDEENEIRYRKLDDHNYLFEGQTLLNDVCRIANIAPSAFDDVRGNADTLAGLALEIKGDIPPAATVIDLDRYRLTIAAADNRKIDLIKLTITA
jgi:CBS domain containing-hemolysin-like protein